MTVTSDWNKERLEELAARRFHGKKLIVVSCRAPYVHEHQSGRIVCVSPAGGLTAALKPTMAAVGGVWIAQATGSADRETASPRGRLNVPPDNPRFGLRRLWISPELRHGHYEGLSNEALWPLCHNVYRRPVFRESDWHAYQGVNRIFADAVLEEAQGQPAVVFIQDYHFALLPRMLKAENPSLTVAHFWHIPFPNRETAQTFPWINSLIDGMLGNDILGFHLPAHCRNFLDTAEDCADGQVDRRSGSVWPEDRPTVVRSAPISIDFRQHSSDAASPGVEQAMQAWSKRIGPATFVGIGIDRMDYTKGILERLRAISTLFRTRPELRGELTFVQVGVPSRSSIPEYARLEQQLDAEVASINQAWGTDRWMPILFEKRNLPPVEMMALHRLANFCAVTPLHDGMNLVAKEFVASRFDGDGTLILSRFAGAAQELKTALLVNPYSETELCAAIETALFMPRAERRQRMKAAREAVEKNNVYRWAGELLDEAANIARVQTTTARLRYATRTASVA